MTAHKYSLSEVQSGRLDIAATCNVLVIWLALKWSLVKHLGGLWLIFLYQLSCLKAKKQLYIALVHSEMLHLQIKLQMLPFMYI